jgi:hypothetical protein
MSLDPKRIRDLRLLGGPAHQMRMKLVNSGRCDPPTGDDASTRWSADPRWPVGAAAGTCREGHQAALHLRLFRRRLGSADRARSTRPGGVHRGQGGPDADPASLRPPAGGLAQPRRAQWLADHLRAGGAGLRPPLRQMLRRAGRGDGHGDPHRRPALFSHGAATPRTHGARILDGDSRGRAAGRPRAASKPGDAGRDL